MGNRMSELTYELIGKEEILTKVKAQLLGVREKVLVTMEADEEKIHPTPKEYFDCFLTTMRNGKTGIRLGFGKRGLYENELRDKVYLPDSLSYTFVPTDSLIIAACRSSMIQADMPEILRSHPTRVVFRDPKWIADYKNTLRTTYRQSHGRHALRG